MSIRVLLVDDVADLRRVVRTTLRFRGGFDVVGDVGSGAEAVQLAVQHQPDVVVLDLGLPDLAGREVLSRIREGCPQTKVVVFSGLDPAASSVADHEVDGYLLKDVAVDRLVDLLESLHSSPTRTATLELPRELTSVRMARRFVSDLLETWGLDGVRDDALLVTSELTANAVTHAASVCRIQVSATGSSLRIDVVDTGQGTPEPQPPSASSEGGRGLHLVSAVTTAWGLEQVPGDGKVVWAELSCPA